MNEQYYVQLVYHSKVSKWYIFFSVLLNCCRGTSNNEDLLLCLKRKKNDCQSQTVISAMLVLTYINFTLAFSYPS